MNSAEATSYYFKRAATIMDIGDRIETLLNTPLREVKVQLAGWTYLPSTYARKPSAPRISFCHSGVPRS